MPSALKLPNHSMPLDHCQYKFWSKLSNKLRCMLTTGCKWECDKNFEVTNSHGIIHTSWLVLNSRETFVAKTAMWCKISLRIRNHFHRNYEPGLTMHVFTVLLIFCPNRIRAHVWQNRILRWSLEAPWSTQTTGSSSAGEPLGESNPQESTNRLALAFSIDTPTPPKSWPTVLFHSSGESSLLIDRDQTTPWGVDSMDLIQSKVWWTLF